MIDPFRRLRGRAIGTPKKSGSFPFCTPRALRSAAWLLLCAVPLLAIGCGDSKKPKESTAAAEPAGEEEAPGQEAAPVARRKHKPNVVAEKPAEPKPPAPSTTDIMKWKLADLDSALARKDVLFVPAVVFYGARGPGDAKRADDLDKLVQKVARMKDDAAIPLPLPPGSFAATDQPAASSGQPAAAAGAKVPNLRLGRKRKKDD